MSNMYRCFHCTENNDENNVMWYAKCKDVEIICEYRLYLKYFNEIFEKLGFTVFTQSFEHCNTFRSHVIVILYICFYL